MIYIVKQLKLPLIGIGSQWGNLFSPADGYNSISVGHVFEMFILESIIFILITIYMDNVNPGKFGLARSFDYPIKVKLLGKQIIESIISSAFVDVTSFY